MVLDKGVVGVIEFHLLGECVLFAVQLPLLPFGYVAAVGARIILLLSGDGIVFVHQLSIVPAEVPFIRVDRIVQMRISGKNFSAARMILHERIVRVVETGFSAQRIFFAIELVVLSARQLSAVRS